MRSDSDVSADRGYLSSITWEYQMDPLKNVPITPHKQKKLNKSKFKVETDLVSANI